MWRLIAYQWFTFVMVTTSILGDNTPALRLRGWLVSWCFKSCGKRLRVSTGVRINSTTNMTVGNDVWFGYSCWINATGGVTLEDEVMVGPFNVVVTTAHTYHNGSYRFGKHAFAPVFIGRGTWTAGHVTIAKGIRIGRGVLIAAGAAVTKDIPDYCIAGGIPAKVLRYVEPSEADALSEELTPVPETTKG